MKGVITTSDEALAVLTFEEIAERMGTSRQNVFNIYARAVKRLRRERAVELTNMQGMASVLEKRRPVDVDWFGDDDEEQTA